MAASIYAPNATLELLQGVPKKLQLDTLQSGFRLLSIQDRPTKGARHVRLHAWHIIQRASEAEVQKAVEEEGWSSASLREEIRLAMEKANVYCVSINGDARFHPPQDFQRRQIIHSYMVDNVGALKERVDEVLFQKASSPASIKQAMEDPSFDRMLEAYYLSGEKTKADRKKLVGRFKSNLLHTCIEDGNTDSVSLLLDFYTEESNSRTPWRVLAEPLFPVGDWEMTAYHSAVKCGSCPSLKLLIAWAQKHDHDIRGLKMVLEREEGTRKPLKEATPLQFAKGLKEHACFNLLAPVFGAELLPEVGSSPSELLRLPHVSLSSSGFVETRLPVCSKTWPGVLAELAKLKPSQDCAVISIHNVSFEDDADKNVFESLFENLHDYHTVQTKQCTFKTDKTLLAYLEVLVRRLQSAASGAAIESLLPREVYLASPSREMLPGEEQAQSDQRALDLVRNYLQIVTLTKGFLEADLVPKSNFGCLPQMEPAVRASSVATRLNQFVANAPNVQGAYAEWAQGQKLLELPCGVKYYFDAGKLLAEQFEDPRQALDEGAVHFLTFALQAWFSPIDPLKDQSTKGKEDPWEFWLQRLGVEDDMVRHLEEALDLALKVLLEMSSFLDYALRTEAKMESLAALLRTYVPAHTLGRLRMVSGELAQQKGPKRPKRR